MAFKDDIRQILADAHAKPPSVNSQFDQVISDLAEVLTNDSLQVVVETPSEIPLRRTVRIHPRYRPEQAREILAFWIERETDIAFVFTDKRRKFTNRESLEEYLTNFVRDPGFVELIIKLERLAEEPVDGYLRVNHPYQISMDDLLLKVMPDQQRYLAESKEGPGLVLELDVSQRAGAGAYKSNIVYRFLNSDGILLQVAHTSMTPEGKIRITGSRLTAASANSSAYAFLSNEALREVGLKLIEGLRGLVSIYRRDKRKLDEAPDEIARRKALHYAQDLESLQEYIRDQYARSRVQVLEYKQELSQRLNSRAPEAPSVNFFRPEDPENLDQIADFLARGTLKLDPSTPA